MIIFISYSRDRAKVKKLAEDLQELGHTVWFDKNLARYGGQKWWKAILEQVRGCDLFIFALSAKSLKSVACKSEYQYAYALDKHILPLMIAKTPIPALPDELQEIQILDYRKGSREQILSLAASLASLPIPRPIPDPAPTEPEVPKRPQGTRRISGYRSWIIVGIALLLAFGAGGALINLLERISVPPAATPTLSPTATFTATSYLLTMTTSPPPNVTSFAKITANNQWKPRFQTFDGVDMALVPTGCFMMGSTELSFNTYLETPISQVCFDEAFWIDKTEVTQAQFKQVGGQAAQSSYFKGDNRPVEQITWFEARDYCAKRGVRLLTEAEWEYAARGPDNLVYPWGNTFDFSKVVWNPGSTVDVGSKPAGASWVGALDLSGNVWEWTSTVSYPYPYKTNDGREDVSSPARRVLRGGSWDSTNEYVMQPAFRYDGRLDEKYDYWGFRCGRSR